MIRSYVFFLRDANGDLLYAQGTTLESNTNTVGEAIAILEASKHCKQTQNNNVIVQQILCY